MDWYQINEVMDCELYARGSIRNREVTDSIFIIASRTTYNPVSIIVGSVCQSAEVITRS
jgi:hypothetical protein